MKCDGSAMEMVTRWSVTWWWSAARPSVGVPERRRASECSLWSVCTYANRNIKCCCYWGTCGHNCVCHSLPSSPSFFFLGSVCHGSRGGCLNVLAELLFFLCPGKQQYCASILNDRQISVALRQQQQWQFTVIIAVIIIICSFFSSLYYYLLLLSTPRQLQFGDYNTNTHTHTG